MREKSVASEKIKPQTLITARREEAEKKTEKREVNLIKEGTEGILSLGVTELVDGVAKHGASPVQTHLGRSGDKGINAQGKATSKESRDSEHLGAICYRLSMEGDVELDGPLDGVVGDYYNPLSAKAQ